MKNLLLLAAVLIAIKTSAQTLPNASFENWTPYTSGENPDGWTTSDSISVHYAGGNTAYSGTDPYDGNLSLHLKSTQITYIIPIKGPGIATNGQIALDQSTVSFKFSGGSPDTVRFRDFTGYYKYAPLGPNEAGFIKIILLRDTAGIKDTVAVGATSFTGTVQNYTPFITNMVYRNYRNNPDTCLIIIQSSTGLNDPNIVPGTELIVDSLGFTGLVGMEELKNNITSVNIYPSPANQQISLEVELKSRMDLTYEIYDLNGKLIQQAKLKSTKEIINVSDISAGKYILKLGDENRNVLFSKNFSIAR